MMIISRQSDEFLMEGISVFSLVSLILYCHSQLQLSNATPSINSTIQFQKE